MRFCEMMPFSGWLLRIQHVSGLFTPLKYYCLFTIYPIEMHYFSISYKAKFRKITKLNQFNESPKQIYPYQTFL